MKTRDCSTCKFFSDEPLPLPKDVCKKKHRPRFYLPTEMQLLANDTMWGYKRKCSDYKEIKND